MAKAMKLMIKRVKCYKWTGAKYSQLVRPGGTGLTGTPVQESSSWPRVISFLYQMHFGWKGEKRFRVSK